MILIFSFNSISIIIYLTCVILNMTSEEVEDTQHIHLTEEDREVKYIDWIMIPVFTAEYMNVFEGNAQVLNIYSEAD
jgi:hypothetical protein